MVFDFGFWDLGFWDLGFWDLGILGFGNFWFWDLGILYVCILDFGCWDFGCFINSHMCWFCGFGILRFWNFGILRFLILGIRDFVSLYFGLWMLDIFVCVHLLRRLWVPAGDHGRTVWNNIGDFQSRQNLSKIRMNRHEHTSACVCLYMCVYTRMYL